MILDAIRQLSDIVEKLPNKDLASLLSEEKYPSVVVNSDNVDMDSVELHSPADEDYYDTFVEILKGFGWEFPEWNVMRKNGIELYIQSFYIVGDFEAFVMEDGSYLNVETGKVCRDLERDILKNVSNGKYSLINIKKFILEKNIDCISGVLSIDEDVDLNDNCGCFLYCTLKDSLIDNCDPKDFLKYFPDRNEEVQSFEITQKMSRTIKSLYRGLVDGLIVLDKDGGHVYGCDYNYGNLISFLDEESLLRFQVRNNLYNFDTVVIAEDGGKLSKKLKGYSWKNTLFVM